MKEKKKSVCHDCLEQFDSTQLWLTPIHWDGIGGPAHSIALCQDCVPARGHNVSDLESIHAVNKKSSRYLGLNG